VIIVLFAGIYEINYLDYASPIPYKYWETITWEDFRGLRRPTHNLQGSTRIAFITCDFEVAEEKKQVSVTTYFHPSRSFVYSRNTFDKNLFTHEMYHLHITELCARLLRKEIHDNLLSGKENELSLYAETFRKKEDSMQREYDYETDHGYRLGDQRKWQSRIDSLLLDLAEFKDPVIAKK
jgi:hypothetical protein